MSDGNIAKSAYTTSAEKVNQSDLNLANVKISKNTLELNYFKKKLYTKYKIDFNASLWFASNCSKVQDGTGIKVTHSGNGNRTGYIYNDLSASPIDVSNCHWVIDVTILDLGGVSSYTTVDRIFMELIDINNVKATYTLITDGNYILYAGKYTIETIPSKPDSVSAIDLTKIKKITLDINCDTLSLDKPVVKFDNLIFYKKPKEKAKVIFGFDGAYAGQVAAGNYLKSLGLMGTFFVGGIYVDTGDGVDRMTLAQLNALYADGHFVANYCATQTSGMWYQNDLNGKITAIQTNAKWLYQHGFGEGAKYISTPGGGYASDEDILFDNGYAEMITGRVHQSNNLKPSSYCKNPTPYAVGPSSNHSYRVDAVDKAIADNAVSIFIFHQCTGQTVDIPYTLFQQIADYVKTKVDAGVLEVITPDKMPKYMLTSWDD